MPRYICHLDGKFFELSSVVEAPVSDLMDEAEFRAYSLQQYGEHYVNLDLPERLERARTVGHSSQHPMDAHKDLEAFIKSEMCSHYGTPVEIEPGNWDTIVDKWHGLEAFKEEWFSDGEEPVATLGDPLHGDQHNVLD